MNARRLDLDHLSVQTFDPQPEPSAQLSLEPVYQTDDERLSLCFVSCDTGCEPQALA